LNTALLIYAKSSDLQPYARLSDLQKIVKDGKYSNTAIYPAAFDPTGKILRSILLIQIHNI